MATMKRKSMATRPGVMSGGKGGFSIVGTRRLRGMMGHTSLTRGIELNGGNFSQEDSSVLKTGAGNWASGFNRSHAWIKRPPESIGINKKPRLLTARELLARYISRRVDRTVQPNKYIPGNTTYADRVERMWPLILCNLPVQFPDPTACDPQMGMCA